MREPTDPDLDFDPDSAEPPPVPEPRVLTDPRAMRALAHPVRMALMEELVVAGELTATQAAAVVGESPANCSFHLRQLAKYGFVEESGSGHGRNRPWRLINGWLDLSTEHVEGEPAAEVALSSLSSMFQERAIGRLRHWWATRNVFPKRWRAAAVSSQTIWWVTPEELDELGADIRAVLYRYYERIEDASRRPPGAAPVEFLAFAYPLQLPALAPDAEGTHPEGGD